MTDSMYSSRPILPTCAKDTFQERLQNGLHVIKFSIDLKRICLQSFRLNKLGINLQIGS